MVRASVLVLFGVALLFAVAWTLPATFRPFVWLVYPFTLIWAIRTINRRQVEIREQEAKTAA